MPGDHRFLGATRDEASGLTLLGARYYDPVVGCFISVDPVLNLNVPAHLHAYVYGFNNPVTFSDASGLEPRDKNGNFDGDPYQKDREVAWPWRVLQAVAAGAQIVAAGLAGLVVQTGIGVVATALTAGAAFKNPLCWRFAAACAIGSVAVGAATAFTVGGTVGGWVRAGLSSGPRDSQEAALGMWLLGTAPGNSLTYGGESDLAQSLQQQPEAQAARDAIAAGSESEDFTYSARTSDLLGTAGNLLREGCTFVSWSTSYVGLGNQTKLGVGSWSGQAVDSCRVVTAGRMLPKSVQKRVFFCDWWPDIPASS